MHKRTKRSFFGLIRPGPGALVAAAFIGPGTIATCSMAGARFGFALLWGLVFSVIATLILQEMAARLGVVARLGLGEALRKQFHKGPQKILTAILVISAITIGNAAFEAGNITGATLGLESLGLPGWFSGRAGVITIGLVTFAVLFSGSYKLIEGVLISLVIMMSLTFFMTAILVRPDITGVLQGMFVPAFPPGSLLTIVGLVGTTVVPYNLFLYASAVKHRFNGPADLPMARRDISFSVILGGFISMAIVISAASAFFGSGAVPQGGRDLAVQLEPLLGPLSAWFIGIGLFAAGISSAITAPLAASWATAGVLGWKDDMRSWPFRFVWIIILASGLIFSLLGIRPLELILFAQAANGILLPIVVGYLLKIMNSKAIMGHHANSWLSNLLGSLVMLVVLALSIRTLLLVFGII